MIPIDRCSQIQVFQRRINGSVDFYRPYDKYVHLFGNMEGEFWFGKWCTIAIYFDDAVRQGSYVTFLKRSHLKVKVVEVPAFSKCF